MECAQLMWLHMAWLIRFATEKEDQAYKAQVATSDSGHPSPKLISANIMHSLDNCHKPTSPGMRMCSPHKELEKVSHLEF